MEALNLTGKQFGDLFVLRSTANSSGSLRWECRCLCGGITLVSSYRLTSGHTKSCGCRKVREGQSRAIDLTGQVFGRLTVLHRAETNSRHIRWLCQCSCGATATVITSQLRGERTKSCGCLKKESMKKHGHCPRSGRSPEYTTWEGMICRTTNPNHKMFKHYGGRGITVDPRWKEFPNFLADMGPRPSKRHSLDRKDNDLGYSKDNCVWATPAMQARNTTRTNFVTLNGERLCLMDACIYAGLQLGSVHTTRIRKGLSIQAAFDYHLARRTHAITDASPSRF